MHQPSVCTMSISPDHAIAGRRGTWRVTFTLGPEGLRVGGAIRLRPPEMGMVRWEVGKVTAAASRPGASCDLQLLDCHPISHHWRHPPMIQIDLLGEELCEGDTITVTIGERGGYSRGFLRRARAQEHAQSDARWDAWIDTEGNKSLQPERAHNDPWLPIESVIMAVGPAAPSRLSLVARQPAPDQDHADLLIVARDGFGNCCEEHVGEALLSDGDSAWALEMESGTVRTRAPVTSGAVVRIHAVDPTHEITGTANPLCTGFASERTVYFGDLHVMTGEGVIASALGDTEYGFRWGRDVAGLDFCTITNKPDKWDHDTALDDAFYTPGEFVTIPGCELGFTIGHKNVYFPTSDAAPPDAASVESLFASVEGREALVIPHHTSVFSESSRRTFWTEHDFDTHDPRFERLIEMCQDRGSMEVEQTGGNVYFGGTGSSVWCALQRGMKVGFVAGTDNHRGQPSEPSPMGGLDLDEVTVGGLTAVLADSLTREGVWDALYNRRCYATQGQRTLLSFELAGRPMGSIIKGEEAAGLADGRELRLRVVGHRRITGIEIVCGDGHVEDLVHTGMASLSDGIIEAQWEDTRPLGSIEPRGDAVFYYLRVTEIDGRMAWSSPIWVTVPGC